MKPRVFIVSSSEGLDVAHALQTELDNWAETTIWSQGTFTPSSTALDDLIRIPGEFDFGVFVFSFEDVVRIRDQEYRSTRDNVVFELGLFIGSLGRERTFLIVPRNQKDLHLPSDLAGLTYLTFDSERIDGNLQAALGPACTGITKALKRLSTSRFRRVNGESEDLLRVLRRIVELHQPSYSQIIVGDWNVIHSIDEMGNGRLNEDLTLIPQIETLYFYLLESNYLEREHESTLKITASNSESGVPLQLLELGRSQGIVSHAIVLDPPATKKRPQCVAIDCERRAIWKDLVEKGEDQGVLRVANKTNRLHFEFGAPARTTWKGFNPTPDVGEVTITPQKITWDIYEPDAGRFSYKLFLDRNK